MILYVLAVVVLAFVAGCLVGQWSTLRSFEHLGRRGWKSWFLGRVYPFPPEAEQIRAARARERAVREGKVPPKRDTLLS